MHSEHTVHLEQFNPCRTRVLFLVVIQVIDLRPYEIENIIKHSRFETPKGDDAQPHVMSDRRIIFRMTINFIGVCSRMTFISA
jgi:hypothetical protein